MLDIETGYIKVEGRDHTVLNYHQSDDEIELDTDEYYAIFIPESMIDDVEIDGEFHNWGKTERGESYHVFGFSDYQSYIYAYANMR